MKNDLNPDAIEKLKLAEPTLQVNWNELKPQLENKKQRRATTKRFVIGSTVIACMTGFLVLAFQETNNPPEFAKQENQDSVAQVAMEDSFNVGSSSEDNSPSLLQLSRQLESLQSKLADLKETREELSWAIAKEKISRTETKPEQLAGFQF